MAGLVDDDVVILVGLRDPVLGVAPAPREARLRLGATLLQPAGQVLQRGRHDEDQQRVGDEPTDVQGALRADRQDGVAARRQDAADLVDRRAVPVAVVVGVLEEAVVLAEVGELVVTNPMPSMPIHFWNDPDGTRYHDSYFDTYPGVWRHGDWITLTSRGSVVIHGRSDSTLNRQGVRMGSADIYEAVERLPEIKESLVIGVEQPDGGYWMPLFVHLAPGATLDEALLARIKRTIREQLSPRHVPDEVIEVPGVPHTLTGKRIEVPVKRLLQGTPLEKAVNPGSIDNLDLLRFYEDLARSRA